MGQDQGTPGEVVATIPGKIGRRRAGAGLPLLKPETVFGTQANSAIELGLAGRGGRGNWISRFFMQEGDARFVAVADVIREKLEQTRAKLDVDPSRAYLGLGACRELMHSKLDAVVLETPPYCFPEMVPEAVDVPGCLKVKQAGELGETILGQVFHYSSSAMSKPVQGLSPSAVRWRNWYHPGFPI
jgi:hypothetical protein